jgi:hypothetical protein
LKLAIRVGVSEKTILAFEARDQWSPPMYLNLVRERLESAGVEFIDGSIVLRNADRP